MTSTTKFPRGKQIERVLPQVLSAVAKEWAQAYVAGRWIPNRPSVVGGGTRHLLSAYDDLVGNNKLVLTILALRGGDGPGISKPDDTAEDAALRSDPAFLALSKIRDQLLGEFYGFSGPEPLVPAVSAVVLQFPSRPESPPRSRRPRT